MPQGVQGPYLVLKVVHGDTIHVSANGQKLKIRTIGLDMPEVRRHDTALPNHHASMAGRSVGGTG
jgi:endonuclease YncB( thermonuclease family)